MSPPPDDPTDTLIEAVAGAHRERDRDGARWHSAWFDLDGDARAAAFEAALLSRTLEAALDPDGLSSTARAVLDRITSARK